MNSLAYVLLAASASGTPVDPRTAAMQFDFAQVTIQRRVIIRVPAMTVPAAPVPVARPIVWREIKGPKCVPMSLLAGASFTKADSVDLFLRGGRRMRAELDDRCPALDYYSGFYLAPTSDGMVCGNRDTIHTRSGGKCGIERFREMVPKK
jgi:hypothetical protein